MHKPLTAPTAAEVHKDLISRLTNNRVGERIVHDPSVGALLMAVADHLSGFYAHVTEEVNKANAKLAEVENRLGALDHDQDKERELRRERMERQ